MFNRNSLPPFPIAGRPVTHFRPGHRRLWPLHPRSLPEEEEVEQVVLRIAEVPSDVRCIRVTAAGPGRTVEREIETHRQRQP